MSIYTHSIAMKMLTNLRNKIVQCSETIDHKISTFFADRLGVKDVKTINALGIDGDLTFSKKVCLFCDLLPLSKIDKAKFKVFLKINNEIVLNNDLLTDDVYFSNLNSYEPFLINTYLENEDFASIKDKITLAIYLLIDDIEMLTSYYIEKPQIYYNKNVGITLPQ